jgi:hypothetical protein
VSHFFIHFLVLITYSLSGNNIFKFTLGPQAYSQLLDLIFKIKIDIIFIIPFFIVIFTSIVIFLHKIISQIITIGKINMFNKSYLIQRNFTDCNGNLFFYRRFLLSESLGYKLTDPRKMDGNISVDLF